MLTPAGWTDEQAAYVDAQIKAHFRALGPQFTVGTPPVTPASTTVPGLLSLKFADLVAPPVVIPASAEVTSVLLADVPCAAGPAVTSLGLTIPNNQAGYWWARWAYAVTNPAAGSSQTTAQPTPARVVRSAGWGMDFGSGLNTGANHQAFNRPDGTQGAFMNGAQPLTMATGDMSATPYDNWSIYEAIIQGDGLGPIDLTIQPLSGDTLTVGRGAYLIARRIA